MRKLLIADCNEDYRTALAAALSGQYQVLCCRSGSEAFALLHQEHPDIFVLDLMLPELDGLTLLERVSANGICPMVLAATPILSDYVFSCAQRLGIEYLVRKPCSIDAIVSRIQDLSRRLKAPEPKSDPVTYVTNLLLALDISTKHNGFAYLREAILLMSRDPAQSVTKMLYPEVARICGATRKMWNGPSVRLWTEPGTNGRKANGRNISPMPGSGPPTQCSSPGWQKPCCGRRNKISAAAYTITKTSQEDFS